MSVEAKNEPGGVLAQATVELPLVRSEPAEARHADHGDAGRPATPGGVRGPADRLYPLDLFRFLAALAVVGFHLVTDLGRRGAWGAGGAGAEATFGAGVSAVADYGWLGVEFFFVISGFVICMSCWGRSLSDFFTSRVTRLMPAYMFAVLLVATVLTIAPVQRAPELSDVLVNLTMLQRFVDVPPVDDVYWTLFIELKFYILFATVVWLGLTYRRVVMFNVIWTVLYLFAGFTEFEPLIAVVDPTFAPYFVAGTTLYLIYRFGPTMLLWGMLAVSVAMTVPSLERRVAPLARTGQISYKVTLVVMFVLFGLMVLLALGKLSWLRWPGLVTVGALTYPVYLLHRQLSWVAVVEFREALPAWLLAAVIVVAVLALGFLTHRLVERPLAQVLRRGLKASFAQVRAASAADATVPSQGRPGGRGAPTGTDGNRDGVGV
jgi:peptidoglycan/LPS O-acetylase OafA/YrhL